MSTALPDDPRAFLDELGRLGIVLSASGDKLRCNAPRGALTPALRERIQEHKAKLLPILGRPDPDADADNQPQTICRDGHLPLSFAQERIWRLSRLDPDHWISGNVSLAYRIDGPLRVDVLECALDAIVQRHEVLRVRCETVADQPRQTLATECHLRLSRSDLSTWSCSRRETELAHWAERMALEPFNLSRPPLLRARLLRLGPERQVLLLCTHLYVFDGWSTAVLLRELSDLYGRFLRGQDAPPPATLQYADFAHWHRHWFEGPEAERQAAYWQARLARTRLVSDLPPAPLTGVARASARLTFELPAFLATALGERCREAGVTLFIGLLAAYQTLLYRHTGQDRLAVGTIASNRRQAWSESLIGSFANTLLMGADFPVGLDFDGLLAQQAGNAREAYLHQDLPLERLLADLPAELTRRPLFRVMFVLHQHGSIEPQGPGLAGLALHRLPPAVTLSPYDLELVMVERDGGLSGEWIYATGRFDHDTMAGLREHFIQVLKQVTDAPDAPLAQLPDWRWPQALDTSPPRLGSGPAPRTALERRIARIWRALFGIEEIGVHDRFSELGGHSLLAIRLTTALEEALNITLEPSTMADFPTIAQLAGRLEAGT